MENAITITEQADYFGVIGTSLQVYPAASLMDYTKKGTPVYYIDLKPIQIPNLRNPLIIIPNIASKSAFILKEKLSTNP